MTLAAEAAADLIQCSIEHNAVSAAPYSWDLQNALAALAEGAEDSAVDTALWGTREDGAKWRVHLLRLVVGAEKD